MFENLNKRSKYFELFKKYRKRGISNGFLAIILSGCNGENSIKVFDGLISTYVPPIPDYNEPIQPDPNFNILQIEENSPYWVNSLLMEEGEVIVSQLQNKHDNVFIYVFPEDKPSYELPNITAWDAANTQMIDATREIFAHLDRVLNTRFEEGFDVNAMNSISISRSLQINTSGFSFFPNENFAVGSDVFIAHDYSKPMFLSDNLTNYDYEVLVHEIGHALGLKHPFAPDRSNVSVLNEFEDNTNHTAMSYDDTAESFSGLFRSLDYMALTKLYGVNPEYNSGDNLYSFSSKIGIFIIDGAGADTIETLEFEEDLYLDIRPGSHSYLGKKSEYITDALQLTISHGSDIENIVSGNGNDIVICNNLSNIVITNAGDDQIYLGEGQDFINSGSGRDVIDFSEHNQSVDVLDIDADSVIEGFDTIYGFHQGPGGDVIDLRSLVLEHISLLPVVLYDQVPLGYIGNHILRIVDPRLSAPDALNDIFSVSNNYSDLHFSDEASTFILGAPSTQTGADQYFYKINIIENELDCIHLASFIGNYLDIETWSSENFLVPEALITI